MLREADSNHRPSGYEPDELPTALSRDIVVGRGIKPLLYGSNRRSITKLTYLDREDQLLPLLLYRHGIAP